MNPEKNQNLTNPEITPTNNKLVAPQQMIIETPINGPIVGSSLTQAKPRKFNIKKVILWLLTISLIAPVAFVVIMIILFFAQGSLKMNRLNDHAKGLEKELSSLVFVEGQSINAKGVVDGDALTASDNPAQSTFAQGSLEVNKSLASLESEVSANLGKSGFKREGGSEAPYYTTSANGGSSYDSIIFRYIKDDDAIRIIYKLDSAYLCPKEYICKHTPKSKPTDNIYPVNGFGTLSVTNMSINFSDKSSDYHSGYIYY